MPTLRRSDDGRVSYLRFFGTREAALAHAVEKNLEADAPLAFVAVHGPEDDYAVVDAETAAELGDGDVERVRLR
jgi:hypothetical protein